MIASYSYSTRYRSVWSAVVTAIWVAGCDFAAIDPATGASLFGDPDGSSGGLFGEPEPVPTTAANKKSSACGTTTTDGVCKDSATIERCIVVTGVGEPQVVQTACGILKECTVVKGKAVCAQKAGTCDAGATVCQGANKVRQCGDAGQWQEFSCATGCKQTAAGAACLPAGVKAYKVQVAYEFRSPNGALSDWAANAEQSPVAQLLGLSLRKDGDGYSTVDAAVTDAEGWLSVNVASGADDAPMIMLIAGKVTEDGASFEYLIAKPEVGDGEQDTALKPAAVAEAKFWLWTVDPTKLDSGSKVTVTQAQGSGVLRVFDYLRFVHAQANAILAGLSLPLVVWMRSNTSWDCGACFSDSPVSPLGYEMWAQAWLPMTAQDESFWSDPVTAHEFGHWVMAGFSTSPNEGGAHCIGVPTLPGQAWSEGFATGFSALIRKDSRYYDKQHGSFFWLDIGQRKYPNLPWVLPKASLGLIQMQDENDVAAMIWELAAQPTIGVKNALFAISSTRLQVDAAKRGYSRHTWEVSKCKKQDLVNTGDPAPFVADYLDALLCEGASAAAIDAVTKPATQLPFPSKSPICD
ncbi:MAG: hypothetical protein EXR77_07100 [Myxococcales bacterium]|nr:hypothetical protein [Myxococcales bacterium]